MGEDTSGPEGCAAFLVVLLLVPVGLLIGFVLYVVLIVPCPEPGTGIGQPAFTAGGSIFCEKTSNPAAWAVFIASCAALVAGWVAILWFVVGEPGTKTDHGRGSSPRPRR